jgi:hypothetical protein
MGWCQPLMQDRLLKPQGQEMPLMARLPSPLPRVNPHILLFCLDAPPLPFL